jgi:peptidoglycan/xylan/chitin deacetylase (PgdA/CDA1 family)
MLREYLRFPGFLRKAVTLSYDDGVRPDKRLIEIMKENGIKGTFNINGGGFAKEITNPTSGKMTAEEVLEAYIPNGMEVACHGYKHLSLGVVPMSHGAADIIDDRRALEELLGTVVNGMAYANGTYNTEVMSMLSSLGILYSRTVKSTENFELFINPLEWNPTCHHNNPKLMDLARAFVTEEGIRPNYRRHTKLFYLWGHAYEFDNNDNWSVIKEFCEYIGNRDDIWYATNKEIYEYVTAYDRLEFSMNGDKVYNPSGFDMYLRIKDKDILVPKGETIVIQ